MLLDAFRPLCAPSTIRPIQTSRLSSSSSSLDELAEKDRTPEIPKIILHSGSSTEASETDGDFTRMDNESDE